MPVMDESGCCCCWAKGSIPTDDGGTCKISKKALPPTDLWNHFCGASEERKSGIRRGTRRRRAGDHPDNASDKKGEETRLLLTEIESEVVFRFCFPRSLRFRCLFSSGVEVPCPSLPRFGWWWCGCSLIMTRMASIVTPLRGRVIRSISA